MYCPLFHISLSGSPRSAWPLRRCASRNSLIGADAPIVIGQAKILVQRNIQPPRRSLVEKNTQRGEPVFAEREIARRRDRLRRNAPKRKHAARHVNRRSHKKISFPASLLKNLFHLDGALEGVARSTFGDHVVRWNSPPDQVIACDLVFVYPGHERIYRTAGNDNRFWLAAVQPPRSEERRVGKGCRSRWWADA